MIVVPFFFDGNQWSGVIDSVPKWHDLLTAYCDKDPSYLNRILQAKMAPMFEIGQLPPDYFLGNSTGVTTGKLPSFGFRREHIPGTIILEDWAVGKDMNLRGAVPLAIQRAFDKLKLVTPS